MLRGDGQVPRHEAEERAPAGAPAPGPALVDAELLAAVAGAEIPPVWNAHRLAVALGLTRDPRKAAELAGLKLTDEEIVALEAEARAQHAGLTEFKPNAIGQVLLAAFATGALRLLANMAAIAPAQLPKALSMIQQALVGVQGSMQPAYTELRMLVRAPSGAVVDMVTAQVVEPPPPPPPVEPAPPDAPAPTVPEAA